MSENRGGGKRGGGGAPGPAVEVEIYSGIEFTRLDSTGPPLLKNTWCKLTGWLWKKRGGRKEGVSE